MEHNNPNEMHQPPPPPPHMRAPRKITTEEVQSYLDWNKTLITEIKEKMNLGKLTECAEHQERLQQNLMYLAAIADWEQKPQTPIMSPQLTLPLGMQPEYYMERPQSVTMPQQQGIFPPYMPWQFDSPQDQLHQQAQEQGIFSPNMPLQFGNPQHQLHQQAQEQQSSPLNMLLQFGNPQHEIHQQTQEQGIFCPNMPLQFGNPQHQLDQQAQEQRSSPLNTLLQFGNPQHEIRQQVQQQGIFFPNNGMLGMHSEAAHGAGSSGGQPSTAGPNDALGGSVQAVSEDGDKQGNSAASHNHSDSDIVSSYLKD